MRKTVLKLLLLGFFAAAGTSALAEPNSLCMYAISMAGGDEGFAYGYCGNSSQSSEHWQCIINAMDNSGKRGYSNDDVPSVIGFAYGFGSCYQA